MRMKSLLPALILLGGVMFGTSAMADFNVDDVYRAANAGKMAEAQAMMDKVLSEHPTSAKAHYVEAELLAKQGKLSMANAELNKAEALKPGLPFAKPEAVRELKQVIAGQAVRAPSHNQQEAGIPLGTVLFGVLILVALIYFISRAVSRRNNPVVYPPNNYPNNAYPNTGYPYGQQPYGAPPMGGGIGSGIVGGLVTGAALGAGMVAGEELMHKMTDGNGHSGGVINDANAGENSWDDANDMGGQDFGINDAGSWDDGGGGDWS
jgi:uncharacterized protein